MKHTVLAFLCLISVSSFSQSAKELWKPILNHSELATYFSGMWEKLGISIDTYNEKITVVNKGDHFELKDGADPNNVDYLLELEANNIQDMAEFGADGKIDTYESYRIMGTLFTPFVRATLSHPMMNKAFQMKMPDELRIHAFQMGNRYYNPMGITYLLLCCCIVPEIIPTLKKDFKRGRIAKRLKGIDLGHYLGYPLVDLQRHFRVA
ncbi:MAG: hypothetical protein ACPG21_14335 [Crocinitomicaceae bacterium]